VQQLEHSLQDTEEDMKHSLDRTTAQIQTLLNSTVDKLDQTVKSAQAEIQYEVDMVKSDVQQYVRTTQDQFSMENSFMKFQLAGTFCLLAILISMWHMTAHIRLFKRPFVQRKILAILWMSPIYAVTSWLSLVFPNFEGYLSIIKDFYEAYVIYQFLGFCISVLGRGDREEVVDLLARHTDHLDPPMRFCGWCRGSYVYDSPRQLANAVLLQCQVFAMQFVFFKPLTAVGLFTCQSPKVNFCTFDSNDHTVVLWGVLPLHVFEDVTLWLKIIQNISVFMAFSGLLKFYHAVQDDLAWCNPFPKFLCIKGIVFMTFWQGLVISFLASTTNVEKNPAAAGSGDEGSASGSGNSADDADLWGKQAQNFLICLEMLLFSIAHFYCFPTDEWQDGYRPVMEKKVRGLRDNMAFGDFVDDLKLILRGNSKDESEEKRTKKKKKKKAQPSGIKDSNDLTLKDDDDDEDGGDENFGGGGGGSTGNESGSGDGSGDNDKDDTNADPNDKTDNQDSDDKGGDIEEGFGGGDDNDNDHVDEAADENKNTDKKVEEDQDEKENEEEEEEGEENVLDISKDDSLDAETMNTLLTSSIRNSLRHKDEEVRNAAHRLLRNRMIEVDRLSEGSLSPSRNDDKSQRSSTEGSSLGMGSASAYGALSVGEKNALAYSSMAPMGGGSAAVDSDNINGNVDANETTSLLGSTSNNNQTSNNNDLLRPSIFTSVGKSMGAMNNFG